MVNGLRLACCLCILMTSPLVAEERSVRTYDRLLQLNGRRALDDPSDWAMRVSSLLQGEYDFFRGTADLFYGQCRESSADWIASKDLHISLHGDVHLGNIGTYQGPGAPGADLHFGLVDFDEAFDGPFQFDLLRGLTALRLAADVTTISTSETDMKVAAQTLVTNYAAALAGEGSASQDVSNHPMAIHALKEARSGKLTKYLAKYTLPDPPRFRRTRAAKGKLSDVMRPLEESEKSRAIAALVECYEHGLSATDRERFRFRDRSELESAILDVALWSRVGSSGSQGLRKYLVLLKSPLVGSQENLILQLKEEPASSAARAGLVEAGQGTSRAAYVCDKYRTMNPATQWLLGHTVIDQVGFLVKTKDPWGKELSTDDIRDVAALYEAAALIGTVVGRGHRISALAMGRLESIQQHLSKNAVQLPDELAARSKSLQLFLAAAYDDLKTDERARAQAMRAQEWLDRISK